MPSTVVSHINYDTDNAILRIAYVSGSVYDYLQVPVEEYYAFKQSTQKGKYLNEKIKRMYRYKKVI